MSPYLLPQPHIYHSAAAMQKKWQPPGLKAQWLLCFVTAVEEGQLARAANRLNLSPAALRHNLSQLESHLGLCLWENNAKQLILHPGAHFLYERAQAILAQLAALKAPSQTAEHTPARIIEMANPWVSATPLAALHSWLSGLSELAPPFALHPAQGNPAQRLKDKHCDFVLHSHAPSDPALSSLAGPRSEFCLVNAQNPGTSLRPEKHLFAQLSSDHWPPEIHPAQIKIFCPDLVSLKHFLLAGAWSSWLPEMLVAPELHHGVLFKQPHFLSPLVFQLYLWGLPETFQAWQIDV